MAHWLLWNKKFAGSLVRPKLSWNIGGKVVVIASFTNIIQIFNRLLALRNLYSEDYSKLK